MLPEGTTLSPPLERELSKSGALTFLFGKVHRIIDSRISSEEEVKPHRRSVRGLLLFVCYGLHTIIPLRCSEGLSEGWWSMCGVCSLLVLSPALDLQLFDGERTEGCDEGRS